MRADMQGITITVDCTCAVDANPTQQHRKAMAEKLGLSEEQVQVCVYLMQQFSADLTHSVAPWAAKQQGRPAHHSPAKHSAALLA